jgi:endonuclease YncB( thermonuclease family)
LIIPSLLFNLYLFNKKGSDLGIPVLGVIDGDTLVLEGKTRLRLRHLDAPELEYCGGEEAKKELEKLVMGKSIIIDEKILDQKGRAMALVYVDDLLINEEMLRSGWVRYHSDQTSVTEELKAVAGEAKGNKIGIFSSKCQQKEENPDNPECLIKGNIDKNKYEDNQKYYFPGCVHYNTATVEKDIGESWFCTEAEAKKAGFVKSERCPEKYIPQ